MSEQDNVKIVKDFFAAIGRGDMQALLALCAEDIEWIIPGKDWPLAGTYRGHAGLAELLEKAEKLETSTEPREFVAQGVLVLVVGFARGRVLATNKAFEDDWIFAMTVENGKVTNIREYIDTQALALASEVDANPTTDHETMIRELYAVAERPGLNPDKFVSVFSEEGTMWDMASGTKFRGQAIGESIASLANAFPDVHREILSIYVADNVVMVEIAIRGTHTGELALASGTVAPTGKTIDVPGCDVYHLEAGKITSFNCYNQSSIMAQQLGLAGI